MPAITALEQTWPVCLVCDAQQEDHESGAECSLCHLAGDRPAAKPSAIANPGGEIR
jgi:hypothetical protein